MKARTTSPAATLSSYSPVCRFIDGPTGSGRFLARRKETDRFFSGNTKKRSLLFPVGGNCSLAAVHTLDRRGANVCSAWDRASGNPQRGRAGQVRARRIARPGWLQRRCQRRAGREPDRCIATYTSIRATTVTWPIPVAACGGSSLTRRATGERRRTIGKSKGRIAHDPRYQQALRSLRSLR